jgi:uridine phosphorylase
VLVGRGDPNLSGCELPYNLRTARNDHPIQVVEQLADALVQKGVKYVDGNIIADDSYFAFEAMEKVEPRRSRFSPMALRFPR